MFAVKGWSLDTETLKPQTEIYKSTKAQDREEKKGKKRKRKHVDEAKQDPNVKPDDVGRLWEQHVEGKGLSKTQKERERKKQKLEQMRDEKAGPYELPNKMAMPEGQRKIEKWEDIVLGTRAEKEGKKKKSKKTLKREQQREKEGKTNGRGLETKEGRRRCHGRGARDSSAGNCTSR